MTGSSEVILTRGENGSAIKAATTTPISSEYKELVLGVVVGVAAKRENTVPDAGL